MKIISTGMVVFFVFPRFSLFSSARKNPNVGGGDKIQGPRPPPRARRPAKDKQGSQTWTADLRSGVELNSKRACNNDCVFVLLYVQVCFRLLLFMC